ncbi:MAG: L,D-transpeptidase, partial [Chloroflexales bacterium]|nr:L,D-transpeptidase [Chloroflexales bacterium]
SLSESSVQAFASVPAWSPALWPHRIEVDLSQQQLYAYEGDLLVYTAPVASGRDGFNTPTGTFAVYDKRREQRMRGAAGGETWDVPRVPWAMYIKGGVALHGTYWHNRFGTGVRLSHGCINLNLDDAEWLYAWADIGTPVTVRR